jgi:hypothetical protein
MSLAVLTFELAVRGIFVRGAVVRGGHFADETVLFSPAFIAACDIERREAFYPRVLVDATVWGAYDKATAELVPKPGSEFLRQLLCMDSDGRWYLNYLWGFRAHPEGGLEEHKRRVEENLTTWRQRPAIRAKYGWLASYHNCFCGWVFPDRHDLVIPPPRDLVPSWCSSGPPGLEGNPDRRM